MSRDHRKLRVFLLADNLIARIYALTERLPSTERFGLQMQLRRAAVSVACNIVEGSARQSTKDYLNFLNIAAGSASEARYLADLCGRLHLLPEEETKPVAESYAGIAAGLEAHIQSLSRKP